MGSAAIQSRSDLCRFYIRRCCATAHSPGVGAGGRKNDLQKFPSLGGVPRYGVRQFSHAVTFAAFSFGDTARQRIRRELAWFSEKRSSKIPLLWRGAPQRRGGLKRRVTRTTPSRFARHPSEGEEFLEKRRETRRLPEPPLRGRGIS